MTQTTDCNGTNSMRKGLQLRMSREALRGDLVHINAQIDESLAKLIAGRERAAQIAEEILRLQFTPNPQMEKFIQDLRQKIMELDVHSTALEKALADVQPIRDALQEALNKADAAIRETEI